MEEEKILITKMLLAALETELITYFKIMTQTRKIDLIQPIYGLISILFFPKNLLKRETYLRAR